MNGGPGMSEFEPIAVVGNWALVRVIAESDAHPRVYLGRESSTKGRYHKSAVPESVFRDLAREYLETVDSE